MPNATQVKQTVFLSEDFNADGDWPPSDSQGFMAWFAGKLASVPELYQDKIEVEVTSDGDEDFCWSMIHIWYNRNETADETFTRIQEERELEIKMERRDRKELDRLSAKYPHHVSSANVQSVVSGVREEVGRGA